MHAPKRWDARQKIPTHSATFTDMSEGIRHDLLLSSSCCVHLDLAPLVRTIASGESRATVRVYEQSNSLFSHKLAYFGALGGPRRPHTNLHKTVGCVVVPMSFVAALVPALMTVFSPHYPSERGAVTRSSIE